MKPPCKGVLRLPDAGSLSIYGALVNRRYILDSGCHQAIDILKFSYPPYYGRTEDRRKHCQFHSVGQYFLRVVLSTGPEGSFVGAAGSSTGMTRTEGQNIIFNVVPNELRDRSRIVLW